jgi:glutathione S-transferase
MASGTMDDAARRWRSIVLSGPWLARHRRVAVPDLIPPWSRGESCAGAFVMAHRRGNGIRRPGGRSSMRLLYSPASPFARVVRIALLETSLDARVTMQEIARARLYSPESDVVAFNPVGRVPTLQLEDGTVLTESKLILDYVDAVSPGPKLLIRDGSDGWRMLAEAGQAWGLLEGVVTWSRALRPPAARRDADVIAREAARVNRAAVSLETAVAEGGYAGPINAAQIVLGVALGFVEPRLPDWPWRVGRPRLSRWHDAIAARPSFRATVPPPL